MTAPAIDLPTTDMPAGYNPDCPLDWCTHVCDDQDGTLYHASDFTDVFVTECCSARSRRMSVSTVRVDQGDEIGRAEVHLLASDIVDHDWALTARQAEQLGRALLAAARNASTRRRTVRR
jgi:hypothetical protein